jgi:transposase-like protein
MQPEIKTITCPNCSSKNLKKSGTKRNKLQRSQRYQCKSCRKTFTLKSQTKGKTYPTNTILTAVSLYNLGHSQTDISKILLKKFKIKPSQKTISNWLNEYKSITTFQKLRKLTTKLYPSEEIIEKYTMLHNNLPYQFQYHKTKLELLLKNKFISYKRFYQPLKSYLENITTKDFPHHIFKENINKEEKQEKRASQLKFQTLKITKLSKNNLANKLANLALNLAKTNKKRHETIQNFFLINDSATIATEIPVYLTKNDIKYYKTKGFKLHLENQVTPITGHIDILQIRNNLIRILDYKPGAKHQNPINQLIIYALALSRRTKLALKDFKAAWFDENNYYEFFPLHAVYPKKSCK